MKEGIRSSHKSNAEINKDVASQRVKKFLQLVFYWQQENILITRFRIALIDFELEQKVE